MAERELAPCPRWVEDEALIRHLLGTFLDKIERNVKPQIRVNSRSTPQLFDFNGQDTQYLWSLIEQLSTSYQLIVIKKQRHTVGQETYENAQIRFDASHEALLRSWLNRPQGGAYITEWNTAVAKYAALFDAPRDFLSSHPILHPEKSADDVVYSLSLLKAELDTPTTLRVLSSKCFWGDSKFLDGREDIPGSLFPLLSGKIRTRPLLINAFIPADSSAVLFIENQDTFLSMVSRADDKARPHGLCFSNMTLVYSAGFRGSAARIREPGNAIFALLGLPGSQAVERFKQWWFLSNGPTLPCYFWGDMDFSGMAILGALGKIFSGIEAWRPGYEAMLKFHKNGISHSPASAGKEKQKDPGATGCHYADARLLPLLRETGRFLDQEVVDMVDLPPHEIPSGRANH